MNVAPAAIQIDTIYQVAVSNKYIVSGQLQTNKDTLFSPLSGSVKWLAAHGELVNHADTICIIKTPVNSFPLNNRAELLHIQNQLQKQISMLAKYLEAVEPEKHQEQFLYLTDQLKELKLIDDEVLSTAKNAKELETLIKMNISRVSKRMKDIAKQQIIKQGSTVYYITSPARGRLNIIGSKPEVDAGDILGNISHTGNGLYAFRADNMPQGEWKSGVRIFAGEKKYGGEIVDQEGNIFILELQKQCAGIDDHTNKQAKMKLISEPVRRILISRSAVIKNGDVEWVFRRKGNIFEKVRVKSAPYNGSLIEITSGLHHNDQIIVSSTEPIWDQSHLKMTGFYAEN